MATLTPDTIQDLVTIAFCLEPLADKPGCTTRFVDLPERPLADFIIAGINSGKYFRAVALEVLGKKSPGIFGHYVEALQGSNAYKSAKTVNFGLLEIMFPAVFARLQCDYEYAVVDKMIEVMKSERPEEVAQMIQARRVAWQTSSDAGKKNFTGDEFAHVLSPYEFYLMLRDHYPPGNSNHQWAEQYRQGLPIIRATITGLAQNQDAPLEVLSQVFNRVAQGQPDLRKGIVADMCATGLFLHLSYR